MNYELNKRIILRKGKDESLLRFHPWIFSGAIHHTEGDKLEEGDLVEVLASDGRFLAIGHWQIGSIAVRVLTFKKQRIDQAFWQKRLAAALDVRKAIGVAEMADGKWSNGKYNDIYRLVHGEGDNLPGLVIDIYGSTAVMQAHSVGMHVCRGEIAEALKAVMGESLKAIYYKSETTLPFKAQLGQENGFLYKDASEDEIVNCKSSNCKINDVAIENGLKFHIDWLKGQKTGFFVDQRDNRALVERYAKGRKVLNMFCYTGGFSVYAMRGGAELVHSVDSSAKAIELVNANMELNFPGDQRHEAFAEDAFKFMEKDPPQPSKGREEMVNGKFLDALAPRRDCSRGRSNGKCLYDLIILDPPAFAKHKDALKNALRGYTKLNAKAFEMIQPGGILFTFSCSQAVNKDQFRTAVFTAAAMARRKVRILHQLHQPADHPVNIYHPEGEYLKGLVLYVE